MRKLLLVWLLAFAFVFAGCAKKESPKMVPQGVSCSSELTWDITPSAKVEKFACYVGKFKGKEMLIYEIKVKNVSDRPVRFRVNIINPEGKSVGGLIPRKGKPPVLQPGKSMSFKYPVKGYLTIPKRLEIYIRELGM